MLESQSSVDLDERVVEQLQSEGLEQREIDAAVPLSVALEFHRRRWISLGLAADLAGLERSEFMRELAERNMPAAGLSDEQVGRELALVESMTKRREKK